MDSTDLTDIDPESEMGEVLAFLSVNFDYAYQPETVAEYTSIPTRAAAYKILDRLNDMGLVKKTPDAYYYAIDDPRISTWTENLNNVDCHRINVGPEPFPITKYD